MVPGIGVWACGCVFGGGTSDAMGKKTRVELSRKKSSRKCSFSTVLRIGLGLEIEEKKENEMTLQRYFKLLSFTTGNPFLWTKLLGISIGRGSGALKGLSSHDFKKMFLPKSITAVEAVVHRRPNVPSFCGSSEAFFSSFFFFFFFAVCRRWGVNRVPTFPRVASFPFSGFFFFSTLF